MFGIERNRLRVIGDGFVPFFFATINLATRIIRVGEFGRDFNGSIEIDQSLVPFSFMEINDTAIVERNSIFRITRQQCGVFGDGFVVAALSGVDKRAIKVGLVVSRPQLYRFGEIGQRLIRFVQFVISLATRIVNPFAFRIERDGLIVVADGFIVITFVKLSLGATVEVVRVFRIELKRLRIIGDGFVVLPFAFIMQSTVGQRVEDIFIGNEVFAVIADENRVIGDGIVHKIHGAFPEEQI